MGPKLSVPWWPTNGNFAAISDMIVQRKNDDRKVVALSVVPLTIAFIEAILVRTQFFGVFSGTPNIA
jgi:hypothetical protein